MKPHLRARAGRVLGNAAALVAVLACGAAAAAPPAAPARAVAPPAPAAGMARVGPGVHRPLFPLSPEEGELPVAAFELDRTPVTNADFLAFVRTHASWRRGAPSPLLADETFLSHWAGPLELGTAADPAQPVTRVSWFAAKAYCEARGARLPAEKEWELAAAAGEKGPDGRAEPGHTEKILGFYATPASKAPPRVGEGPANFWGVHDLHGLVWEWVQDFGSALLESDSRGGAEASRFCGGGAAGAKEKGDYATFMRLAMRSSLEGRYTLASLGFRCARDVRGPR